MKKDNGRYSMVTCSECGITFLITPEKEGKYVSNAVSHELSDSILLFNSHVCEHCYEEIVFRQTENDIYKQIGSKLNAYRISRNQNELLEMEIRALLENEQVMWHGFYTFHDKLLGKGIFSRGTTQFYPIKEIVTARSF